MKIGLFTNEFPPNIYGGAGIHVKFLSQELRPHCEQEIRCFGHQDIAEEGFRVQGIQSRSLEHTGMKTQDLRNKIYAPLDINLQMAASLTDADLVHCHTWYTHHAGVLASTMNDIPLILSTHSLEPHRPWKVEQLGTGYNMSCDIEKHAYQKADGIIAVSQGMKKDVIDLYGVSPDKVQVIYNGIDPDFYTPTFDPSILGKHGIDADKPFILFVGRITRQKGITQLLSAIHHLDPEIQVVLCAGAPDTPEIAQEMQQKMQQLNEVRQGVFWIEDMLPHEELRILYSHASLFITPSLYEPFGIINLEAMSCGTPVVGSAVGGIPEIIIDGETGALVPLEPHSEFDSNPRDPELFQTTLARTINDLMAQPEKIREMGAASRKRVEDVFSWKGIASQTFDFYQRVIENFKKS
jgi:glycogen synthase